MQKAVDIFYKILDVLLIVLLAGMAIMVFTNVVMRYVMNSGIPMSDELSRYFFVWITFVGAVVALREHSLMGIETFVMFLGRKGRLICMILSNIIILACSSMFFWGAWKQFAINASMKAPVTGIPMVWVYGIGLFSGSMMAIIAALRLFRYLTGGVKEEEIAAFAGENLSVEQLSER